MSLTLGRESLANLISDDLATRNTNKGLIETEVNAKAGSVDVYTKTENDILLGAKETIVNVDILKGTGWTTESVKGNAGDIALKTSKSEIAYDVDTSAFIANTLASGAIIERGSNANGEYVKFADGTLICYGNVQASYATSYQFRSTWTHPYVFSTSPLILAKPVRWDSNGADGTNISDITFLYGKIIETADPYTPPSTSTVGIAFASVNNVALFVAGEYIRGSLLAIGRWK